MKNHLPVSLHVLVNRIMKSLQPASLSKRNQVINDIPLSLMVTPDEQTIATLFNILLQAALSQSGNSITHISGRLQSDTIMLYVREKNIQEDFIFLKSRPASSAVAFSFAHTNNRA